MAAIPTTIPRIFVCGLEEMPWHVERLRPDRLVSVLSPEYQPETPSEIRPRDHLRLEFNDVIRAEDGAVACEREHIEALVAFVREAGPDASILIHCMAGVSRSTAAALIALALEAPGLERECAARLRRAAPFAHPNPLMIALADEVLARGGRLVEALEAMGPYDADADLGLISLRRRSNGA